MASRILRAWGYFARKDRKDYTGGVLVRCNAGYIKEWRNSITKEAWEYASVRERSDVAQEAQEAPRSPQEPPNSRKQRQFENFTIESFLKMFK